MGIYRVCIDEVGNHDSEHVEDPHRRFLWRLAGCKACMIRRRALMPAGPTNTALSAPTASLWRPDHET